MENLFLVLFSVVVCEVVSVPNGSLNFVPQDNSGKGAVGNLRHGVRTLGEIKEDSSCFCGLMGASKIYGGTTASKKEYPWMAAVCHYARCSLSSFSCGGSLINDQFVLTAGHCVWSMKEKDIFVTLGTRKLSLPRESGSQDYRALKIIRPMGCEARSLKNDIALIKLDRKVKFSLSIAPVCIPEENMSYIGRRAVLTGWGAARKRGPLEDILKQTELRVISRQECLKPLRKILGEFTITESLCTMEDNTRGCIGDTGGPLVYESRSGLYEQIGIFSGGWNCTSSEFPGVYTKVDKYLGFIRTHTQNATYCSGGWIN